MNNIERRLTALEERIPKGGRIVALIRRLACGNWQIMGDSRVFETSEAASAASNAKVVINLTRRKNIK